jgi:hypothetical protein
MAALAAMNPSQSHRVVAISVRHSALWGSGM